MADPVTLATAGMGASALGGLTSAAGALFSGDATSQMYSYQSAVAQINQQIMSQNAEYASAEGEVAAQEQALKTRAEIGTTKAQQGASGLDVSGGSASQVRSSELAIGEENQALIRSDAAMRAYGYNVQGWQYGAQASADTAAASNAKTASYFQASSSILSSAGSVSSKWLQGSQMGIF